MKKIALIVVVVAVVVYVFGFLVPNYKEKKLAQIEQANASATPAEGGDEKGSSRMGGGPGGPGMGAPRRNPMDDLKNEDGQIVIAKIDEADMPEEFKTSMKENMTEADADADGLLNDEEQAKLREIQNAKRLERTFDSLKNDEGKYDLAKLEEARMFPAMKETIKGADADGFLNDEELQAAKTAVAEAMAKGPGMGGGRGMGPGGPRPEGGPGMGPGGPRGPEGAPAPEAAE